MIKTHSVYYPLYADTSKPIILITGGRGSGKSYAVSTFLERLSFEFQMATNKYGQEERIVHNILFSRYTMTSAELSVIPEFLESIYYSLPGHQDACGKMIGMMFQPA